MVIVRHLQLPSKVNMVNLASLLGKLNFDKSRMIWRRFHIRASWQRTKYSFREIALPLLIEFETQLN